MPKGVNTPKDKMAAFRAEYLCSGNASGAARAVDLPESTGRDLARDLEQDESFVAARRELHASALQRLISMRMRVAEKAAERFEEDAPEVPENAENVTIIDKRPDYGRLVMDAEKNAHGLAKLESGKSDTDPVTFNVILQDAEDRPASNAGAKPSVSGNEA